MAATLDSADSRMDDSTTGFEQLEDQLFRRLLSAMAPKDLGRLQAVNRRWRAAASDWQVRRAAFVAHWKLTDCQGLPRKWHFLETAELSSFVKRHEVQRGDTLQMLAVRHGVSVVALKRVNNMTSEHALYSRQHVYIPVADARELECQCTMITWCPLGCRDVAVLMAEGPQQQPSHALSESDMRLQVQALRSKLTQLLGRSLHVDEGTAKYYLEEAGFDMKEAIKHYERDNKWESTTVGPIRTAPVSCWIRGEVGF